MTEVTEELDLIQQLEDKNAALIRVMRQLDKVKRSKEEYIATLYQAVRDATEGLVIPPVVSPPKDRRTRGEEVAVPLVSDLQLAKITATYNSEVCEDRMRLYAQKIIELTEIQRTDHPVKTATVLCLGDMIEGGGNIFPGQTWLIDSGLYRQICVDGPRIMVSFFQTLLTYFDSLHVVWVIGNHGRIGRKGDYNPEDNGDRMLGTIVRGLMQHEPRITWQIPDGLGERNWYAIAEVGNWSGLCIHGDQIRGQLGLPYYGFQKKINSWAAGAIREPFQDILLGHWHQRALIPLNTRNVYVNGSTEDFNSFAQETLAAMSDPSQWLLYVHPEKGRVTATYGVDLLGE